MNNNGSLEYPGLNIDQIKSTAYPPGDEYFVFEYDGVLDKDIAQPLTETEYEEEIQEIIRLHNAFPPKVNSLTPEERLNIVEDKVIVTPTQKYNELISNNNPSLEERKELKIASLAENCTKSIYEGFTSETTGYIFGFNDHDQRNFNSQTNKLNLWKNLLSDGRYTQSDYDSKFPISWKTKSDGVVELSEQEFIDVIDEGEAHLLEQQYRYWTLEKQVIEAIDSETVDSVVW